METYTTEEQQVEAIKKFWKDNGISIIIGAVVGFGGIFGYKQYQAQQIIDKSADSAAYEKAIDGLELDNIAAVESFIAENKDSGYSDLASLVLAKKLVEAGDLEKAAIQLAGVAKESKKEEIKALANIRLARVYLALDKAEDALSITNSSYPESFKAKFSELQGDIYVAQGKLEQARVAYQAAADNGGLRANPSLKMKLDDLAINSTVVVAK